MSAVGGSSLLNREELEYYFVPPILTVKGRYKPQLSRPPIFPFK